MKRNPLNESGFIPLLLTVLALVVIIVCVVYTRVVNAQ
jgi:hypothetical protein